MSEDDPLPYTDQQTEIFHRQLERLRLCFESEYLPYYEWELTELVPELGDIEGVELKLLEVRFEKLLLTRIKKALEISVSFNSQFKEITGWAILDQMLTITRLKEIAAVKIVKKGGRGAGLRYDITSLLHSYFGKKILHGLGMQRRRVATKDELDSIRTACAKIKLTLPEVIEPTTTEQFFAAKDVDTDKEEAETA